MTSQYRDTIKIKIKRLIESIFDQLLWIVPAWLICQYIELHLDEWIQMYFNVSTSQKAADILARKAELLSDPVILNPSTISAYLKAAFNSMSASTKAFSVASLAGICSGIGNMVLYILRIFIVVLGILKIRSGYKQMRHRSLISNQICQEIMPELAQIKADLQVLKSELLNKEK